MALGPKIGWREEGMHAFRHRGVPTLQMIYNLLEQDPGRELLAVAAETGGTTVVRVPHSSGMLEGNLTADTVFPEGDHRRHRPRSWLVEGVQKVATLDFLTHGRRWARPRCSGSWPTPASPRRCRTSTAARSSRSSRPPPICPPLTEDELTRVAELYAENFGVAATVTS